MYYDSYLQIYFASEKKAEWNAELGFYGRRSAAYGGVLLGGCVCTANGGAAYSPALLPCVVHGQLHVLRLLRAEAELRHQVQTMLRRVAVAHLSYRHQKEPKVRNFQVQKTRTSGYMIQGNELPSTEDRNIRFTSKVRNFQVQKTGTLGYMIQGKEPPSTEDRNIRFTSKVRNFQVQETGTSGYMIQGKALEVQNSSINKLSYGLLPNWKSVNIYI